MKVLLVNGSPHKNGCTYTALSEAAKTLNEENIETEIFWIGNKAISGCMGCKGCVQKGKCVFDDCVNEFVEKAAEADGERAGPDRSLDLRDGKGAERLGRALELGRECADGLGRGLRAFVRRGGLRRGSLVGWPVE